MGSSGSGKPGAVGRPSAETQTTLRRAGTRVEELGTCTQPCGISPPIIAFIAPVAPLDPWRTLEGGKGRRQQRLRGVAAGIQCHAHRPQAQRVRHRQQLQQEAGGGGGQRGGRAGCLGLGKGRVGAEGQVAVPGFGSTRVKTGRVLGSWGDAAAPFGSWQIQDASRGPAGVVQWACRVPTSPSLSRSSAGEGQGSAAVS